MQIHAAKSPPNTNQIIYSWHQIFRGNLCFLYKVAMHWARIIFSSLDNNNNHHYIYHHHYLHNIINHNQNMMIETSLRTN